MNNLKCNKCEHRIEARRLFGNTFHCELDPLYMDVTNIKEYNVHCPLNKKGGDKDGCSM